MNLINRNLKLNSESIPLLKVSFSAPKGKILVNEPGNAERIFRTILGPDAFLQQQIYCLFVSPNGELICQRMICSGSIDCVLVNIKMMLAIALQCFATGIIIGHTKPYFESFSEYSQAHDFIKMFNSHADFMGIRLDGYYLLSETHIENVFETLDITVSVPKPMILS